MIVIRQQNLLKPVLLVAAMCLLQAAPAAADVESAVADLKACVNGNLASEKAKTKPKVSALLNSCNAEYQALRRELPEGLKDAVDVHVRSDLQDLLRDS